MGERGQRPLVRGEAGAGDRLRTHGPLVLHGLTAPVVATVLALLIGGGRHPERAAGAVVFLLLAAVPVWAPLLAGGGLRTLAAAAGLFIAPVPAALLTGEAIVPALGAGAAAAGFLLLVAGVAAGTTRLSGRPSAGVAVAGLVGIGLLACFHLGDPLIEWSGAGKGSTTALTLLHAANPASGAVGHALDVDWLRLPIMYSGFPGTTTDGLSSAQYYPWHYFPWWGTALLHGALGLILLAGAFRGQRLRWATE